MRRNDELSLDRRRGAAPVRDRHLSRPRAARGRRYQRAAGKGLGGPVAPSSGFASATRRSGMPSGPTWCGRRNCSTAKRRRSPTTAVGSSKACLSPLRPPATTPWWSSGPPWATTWRSSAWAEDGTVMGIRHRTLAVDGVQFHPEAVLTEGGHRLLANWLGSCGFGQASGEPPDARWRWPRVRAVLSRYRPAPRRARFPEPALVAGGPGAVTVVVGRQGGGAHRGGPLRSQAAWWCRAGHRRRRGGGGCRRRRSQSRRSWCSLPWTSWRSPLW